MKNFYTQFSNTDFFNPNVRCKEQIQKQNLRKEIKAMDFVTRNNVVLDHEKVADSKAALLLFDTLMAAEKDKQRKEKKHA